MADQPEKLMKIGDLSEETKQGFTPYSTASTPPSLPPLPRNHVSSPSSASPPSTAATNHPSPPSTPPPAPPPSFDRIAKPIPSRPPSSSDPHHQKRLRMQRRISWFQEGAHPTYGPTDVDISLSSCDGFQISIGAHFSVLSSRSRHLAERLRDLAGGAGSRRAVEMNGLDDVEPYLDVVIMMYREDLRRWFTGAEVELVLGLLEASANLKFDAGVKACLEYLEAVPWTEEEEEEVINVSRRLQLQLPGMATESLQRVSAEPSSPAEADSLFSQILSRVIHAEDEKARQDMKGLLSGFLGEDKAQSTGDGARTDVSRETLYHLCRQCLNSLQLCFSEYAGMDDGTQDLGVLMGKIAREAGNVQWLLEILTGKKMADEFVMLWADQTELATLHSKIPGMYRYEISGITAQLCVALGKRQILVGQGARFSLLRTWLEALYDDFRWMRNSRRTYDKKTVEEALCQTILTLPMAQQQTILLRWCDCFLEKGGDCPNIQRAFEVWWRRAFVRRIVANEDDSGD